MRYLVAMIFAVAVAAAATVFVSSPVASWFVAQPWVVHTLNFDNPDQVADLHSAVFMAVNLIGMLIGWTFGWMLGGSLAGKSGDA